VHILGGSQTDFAKKWAKSNEHPLMAMMDEAAHSALADAGIDATDVQTVHVANFIAESATGQSQLNALVPMLDPAWTSLPTARHEAACASGSVAALAASAEIEAGRYDVALVLGVELLRDLDERDGGQLMGSAAWVNGDEYDVALPWPDLFDKVAGEIEARQGLDRQVLTRIAEINRTNARRNPNAQSRGWELTPDMLADDGAKNPLVIGSTRRIHCGLITDGAAAVVLASDRFVEEWSRRRGESAVKSSRILGWGHRTGPLSLQAKFDLSRDQPYIFPHLRSAVTDAYGRAGITADDLDVVELHDCFAINEYLGIEHLGIAEPGEAWKAVESGIIDFDGATPVNPSGGLLGAGHPVGASGVRMLLDTHKQVTDSAGDYQVEGSQTAVTLNIGGTCSTAVSFVVGQEV
jgi:acetyl-CoA C-acetyltransferase